MPRFSPSLTVPLCLGGNVFGWTADEAGSFAVLDAFVEGGGTFIDTADGYSAWVDGNKGGESETILGRWLAERGNRDDIVLATKVGALPSRKGLKADNVKQACEDSLARLGTDRIDLYFAHFDDEDTPMEETFGAFDELVSEGKVLQYGLSNYKPDRLRAALELAPDVAALQPEYNLVERGSFEGERQNLAREHDLAVVPYYALASGFLAGKYRPQDAQDNEASPRAGGARKYLESDMGLQVLEALDAIAGETEQPVAAVGLAWIAAQPTVLAPIASARTPEQLSDLLAVADVTLSGDQLERLTAASS